MRIIKQLRLSLELLRIHRKSKTFAVVVLFSIIFICMILIPQFYQAHPFQSHSIQTETADDTPNHEDSSMHEESKTKHYVVDNPLCRIPEFNPYHKSIRKYIIKKELEKCSELAPLTSVTFNAKTKKHTLKVNAKVTSEYLANNESSLLRCCFSVAKRRRRKGKYQTEDDEHYVIKQKKKCFKNKVNLPENAEYIYVNCNAKDKRIFHTIYFLVIDKNPKSVCRKAKINEKKYSLFMFAIDSVSRLNFMRTLPKTRKYIESRGWLPLEGYVKVGENTFPNAVPILSGMRVGQLKNLCYPHQYHTFDDCPFIWKDFSENGYLTSYCEDQAWLSTFNHEKYGFMDSPTDYYSRPVSMLAERLIGRKRGDDFCLGPEPEIESLFRFNAEFLQRFGDRPYFNLFWTNSMSHSDLNRLMTMDTRIRTFLQDIEHYLNSTVVILFGDHGFRDDAFRQTYLGWHEDRTPVIYFHLPPSLKASRPQWYRNLRANRNKLTSPFDLHATLRQLLHDQPVEAPVGCPKCGSLFAPVELNRSCADAGIDEKWCPCWTANNASSPFKPPRNAPEFTLINHL